MAERYKKKDEDFQQNYFGKTARGIGRKGHVSIRLWKCMAYCEYFHEIINYFDLMASVLSFLNKETF